MSSLSPRCECRDGSLGATHGNRLRPSGLVVCLVGRADTDSGRLESDYRALLPGDEVARCDRFVFAEGRRQCLISRMLVRTVLSSYTSHDPAVWRFVENGYGKPAIAHPEDCPLRFNLSHTTGLVVCAVSRSYEVGVDAEDCQRRLADESIAQHYFAPEEVASLEATLPDERPQRFLEFWTLKEAFLKAHGSGLSIPLKDFGFVLPSDQRRRSISTIPALGDANCWQFLPCDCAGGFRSPWLSSSPSSGR
jgi:4'-phosphopantetheinyl transferase